MMDPTLQSEAAEDVLMDPSSPATALHLQSLPPFLHPISPSLAALHMARMRLYRSIPPSYKIPASWCARCGGLREDKIGGPSKRRTSLPVALVIPALAPERRIERTTSLTELPEVVDDLGMDVDVTADLDSSNTPTGKRKKPKPECVHCGHAFTRPKPQRSVLAQFAAARHVRAVRQQALANPSTALPTSAPISSRASPVSSPASTPTSALGLTLTLGGDITPTGETGSDREGKPRPTLLQTPSLAYIPKEDPNPPTYPQPQSTPSSKRNGSPEAGKNKKRKMKKSGLARLLAESKGREEASLARGRWGLD